eukprot:SAG22_NODE_470_length_10142_cov_13.947227_7_plen_181_part_00
MRREGFELSVSPPKVLYATDPETNQMTEPMEELMIEVDEDMTGMVMEHLQARRGELRDQTVAPSRVAGQASRARLLYAVPSRGLVGYRAVFQSSTRGTGVLNRRFVGYELHKVRAPARALHVDWLARIGGGRARGGCLASAQLSPIRRCSQPMLARGPACRGLPMTIRDFTRKPERVYNV